MKLLSSAQIRQADQFTIQNEPISSVDLMERASLACTIKLLELLPTTSSFAIFCGTGNNGGDGLAIARLLHEKGVDIAVYLVRFSDQLSPDNATNLERLKLLGIDVNEVSSSVDFPVIKAETIVLDGLVGTGLTRPLEGFLLETVQFLNELDAIRVAIDIPSGMFCDADNINSLDKIYRADITLTFQAPKLNFMLPDMHSFVGNWHVLDIGLDKDFVQKQHANDFLVDQRTVSSLLKTRPPFSHKGTFGHALIAAGSFGKVGAAVLSTQACLHSGVGLVSVFVPSCGYEIIQTTAPEAMVHCAVTENELSGSIDIQSYEAVGVGPGIGQSPSVQETVETLIKQANKPLVLDADALNCIALNPGLLSSLPKGSILTPHLKEFERMFGKSDSSFERLLKQREASNTYDVHIVLKGKNSSISCPEGHVYFNSTGNPGMATGGSGDVLTGLLTGLLAQGYDPKGAAILGCYIHGAAGDFAAEKQSEEAMVASDITNCFGDVFQALHLQE